MAQLQTGEVSGPDYKANCEMMKKEWMSFIIAQADSGGYDPSGYVVWEINGIYYFGNYSHCSCYDTFGDLCATGDYSRESTVGEPGYIWCGFKDALIDLAKRRADPHLPHLASNKKDHDYSILRDLYKQVLKYFGEKNGQ
jgi:hypothetical protein